MRLYELFEARHERLFHITPVGLAYQILDHGYFKCSQQAGDTDYSAHRYVGNTPVRYFLSVARSPQSAYVRQMTRRSDAYVLLELDGDRIIGNNKVQPYRDQRGYEALFKNTMGNNLNRLPKYKDKSEAELNKIAKRLVSNKSPLSTGILSQAHYEANEMEERIYSKTPTIPIRAPINQTILAAHVFLGERAGYRKDRVMKDLMVFKALCEELEVPIYVYNDPKQALLMRPTQNNQFDLTHQDSVNDTSTV